MAVEKLKDDNADGDNGTAVGDNSLLEGWNKLGTKL